MLPADLLAVLLPFLIVGRDHIRAGLCLTFLALALFRSGGLYASRLHLSVSDEAPSLVGRLLSSAAVVATVTGLRHDHQNISKFLGISAVSCLLVLLGRVLCFFLIRQARTRRIVSHRTLIVGSGPMAREVVKVVGSYPEYGIETVGYVDEVASGSFPVRFWGDISVLGAAIRESGARIVLIADGNFTESRLTEILRTAQIGSVATMIVPRVPQVDTLSGIPDHVGAIRIMRLRPPRLEGGAWAVKRAFDIVVSSLALVVLSPILAVAALGVRLETGKGILFRQQRVGQGGELFEVLKFRSMRPVNEAESQTNWNIAQDNRLGPWGKFLRKTSIDELPQLLNILRGEMTIVGPRPERPYFVDQFSREHPEYAFRHRVPVGLTGLAQVHGLRGDTSINDRARFDNFYIEHWSLWLDVKVILRTVKELVGARGG